jgi:hypothetical protein
MVSNERVIYLAVRICVERRMMMYGTVCIYMKYTDLLNFAGPLSEKAAR